MKKNNGYTEVVKLGPLGTFVLLIWAGSLNARPATTRLLQRATGLSKYKTVTALDRLRAAGYVREAGEIWQLTFNIVQLPMFVDVDVSHLLPVVDAQPEKNFSLVVVVNNNSNKDSIKLTTTTEKNFFAETEKLLDGCEQLFGERPFGELGNYRNVNLLGWIAQVYDNRLNLRYPARVLYRNIKAGRKPRKRYTAAPEKYLPDELLSLVG